MIRGYFYRILMRFAHRYGWHYAPGKPEPYPRKYDCEAGASFHWCHWCGLRGYTFKPTGPLRVKPETKHSGYEIGSGRPH